MYLVDTCVWLEGLLEQERGAQATTFLNKADPAEIAITDFALHSIGVILGYRKREALFESFLRDVVLSSQTRVIRLEPSHLRLLVSNMRSLGLDFDDAYHYLAAEEFGCTIVSFDAHFDKTPLGRKAPGEII